MGKKVDFSSKSSKNKKKKIKIVAIVIGGVFITYLIVESSIRAYKSLPQTIPENNKLYYNVDEYQSLEELLNGYETNYISTDNSSEIPKIYVSFDRYLYTGSQSNKQHFWGLSSALAKYRDFNSFELIDSNKNINIKLICENDSIVEFVINGDKNYYLNKDSEINSNSNKSVITNFTIQSQELKDLIENDWNDFNINFGTRESICKEYNIYFDEGIKYKKVGKQVYNLIFTTKYKNKIAGELNALSTKEEVEYALGKPTFSDGNSVYGYLGENNYLFFDFMNQEVSIYPVITIDKSDEEELIKIIEKMNESSNIKEFASDITDLWTDYDIYDFNSNYVDLKYTLRGIELKITSSSLENGIFIYKNYSGDKSIQNLENVYINKEDLVFQAEKLRVYNDKLNRIEQGEYTEEQLAEMGIEFSVRFQGELFEGEKGFKGPVFFSREQEYPDSELDKRLVISSYKWYDDYKFVYSVDNEGIYVYNCKTRVNAKIVDISESIIINKASDGEIVYNDVKVLDVNID